MIRMRPKQRWTNRKQLNRIWSGVNNWTFQTNVNGNSTQQIRFDDPKTEREKKKKTQTVSANQLVETTERERDEQENINNEK